MRGKMAPARMRREGCAILLQRWFLPGASKEMPSSQSVFLALSWLSGGAGPALIGTPIAT